MIELNKIAPHTAKHPGDYIKEELDKIGWQQQDLADVMGVSMKHVSELLNKKKGITFETAILLSQALGYSVEYWLNQDTIYRLFLKSQKESKKKSSIEEKSYIYQRMPILEMQKRGWLNASKTIEELKKEVMDFWNIQNFDLGFMDNLTQPAYRTGVRQYNHYFASCWFHKAKSIAATKPGKEFVPESLWKLLEGIGQYLQHPEEIPSFIEALENTGVTFFVLPHLKQTYNNGAAFLNDKSQPVIVLTMRYDRIDHFWFTILHEVAHVLCHSTYLKEGFLDSENTVSSEIEEEANSKAGYWLNIDKVIEHFSGKSFISDMEIKRFSKDIGSHPSIVRGLLMWKGKIDPSRLHKDNVPITKNLAKWQCP